MAYTRRYLSFAILGLAALAGCHGDASLGESTVRLASPELSCSKSEPLLISVLEDADRVCITDETCPCGSYCDTGGGAATGICTLECITTDHAEFGCAGDDVCDSQGRCVPPGGEEIAEAVPRIDTDPRVLRFRAEPAGFTAQPITVMLDSSDPPAADLAPLRLVPGDGLEIACGAGTPASEPCTLADWSFAEVGGRWIAEQVITVVPSAGSTQTGWTLSLGFPDAEPLLVTVLRLEAQPMDGRYTGTLIDDDGAVPVEIPVTAWSRGDDLLIVDPTHTLAPSGKIRLPGVGVERAVSWLAGDDDATLGGRFVASHELASRDYEPYEGAMTGEVVVRLPSSPGLARRWQLALSRTGALPEDGCGVCASGVCDASLDVCLPGPAVETALMAVANLYEHPRVAGWWNVVKPRLTASSPGFSRSSAATAEEVICLDASNPRSETGNQFARYSDAVTGDLQCRGGKRRQRAVGLVSHKLLAASQQKTNLEMFSECIAELTRAPAGSSLGSVFQDDACISLSRFFAALELSATGGEGLGVAAPHDRRGTGLFVRLLQQWAQVNGFVAGEGVREARLADMLASLSDEDDVSSLTSNEAFMRDNAPTSGQLLDILDDNWLVMLDGAYADALAALNRSQARTPDYRRDKEPEFYWNFQDTNRTWVVADVMGNYPLWNYLTWGTPMPSTTPCWQVNKGKPYLLSGPKCKHFAAVPYYGANLTLSMSVKFDAHGSEFLDPPYWLLYKSAALEVRYRNRGARGIDVSHAEPGGGRTQVTFPLGYASLYNKSLAIVRDTDNRTYRLYLNGVLLGTQSYAGEVASGSSDLAWVGADQDDTSLNFFGTIDDVALWDSMMSPSYLQHINGRDKQSTRPAQVAWHYTYEIAEPAAGVTHLQEQGLPVAVLDALRAYLDVVDAHLSGAARYSHTACAGGEPAPELSAALVRAARSLRIAEAVEQQMHALADVAGSSSWRDEYDTAATALAAARARAVQRATTLSQCRSPLGISEADLPLYFEDPQGNLGRFFAGSHYLSSLVQQPLAEAKGLLEQARAAYRSQFESKVQATLNDVAAGDREAALASRYGQVVVDLCGLSMDSTEVFDAVNEGQLELEGCYLSASCQSYVTRPLEEVPTSCLRGELGQALVDFKVAGARLNSAKSAWDGAQQSALTWEGHCADKQAAGDAAAEVIERYARYRQRANDSGGLMGAFKNVTNIFLGAATGQVGAVTDGLFGLVSGPMEHELAQKGIAHEEFLQLRQITETLRDCWHQAEQAEIPVSTAEQNFMVAAIEAEGAMLRFKNLRQTLHQRFEEGNAALARARGERVPSLAHHFWAAEKAEKYEYWLEQARLRAFLFLRVAEYEVQASFGLQRDAILTATHPFQIERAYDELASTLASTSPYGARPEHSYKVLSLRDDILRLLDRSSLPPGEQNLPLSEVFRLRLLSPRNAVRDREGNYLGQGIRFSLTPENAGIITRCAERLWYVNAQYLADGTDDNLTLKLLKRESFTSRWCGDQERDAPYQRATLRPDKNLFLPGQPSAFIRPKDWGVAEINSLLNDGQESINFKDQENYTNNASEELAARGLYGEYILLIPAQVIQGGFDLGKLEDVKLRFDLYSLENLSQP